ncbi:hypothetical protein ACUN9Z_14075, partial [Escherichia sp. HC-CC4]
YVSGGKRNRPGQTAAIPQWAAEEGHAITDYQQIGDAAWSITVQKA